MHLGLLIKDAWRTKSWNDKFRIWVMPTGWRPADVAEKYPMFKINDVYQMEKYDTKASTGLHVWSWVQISMTLLFISYLFGNIAAINTLNAYYIYIYGLFIFLTIYAYTELMDRNKYAVVWEVIKNSLGVAILLQTGDWFGAASLSFSIKYIVAAYFLLSTMVTLWFVMKHAKEDAQVVAMA